MFTHKKCIHCTPVPKEAPSPDRINNVLSVTEMPVGYSEKQAFVGKVGVGGERCRERRNESKPGENLETSVCCILQRSN